MTLVRYEPWRLLNRFHRDFSPFFDRASLDDASTAPAAAASVSWLPSVDVREEEARFVVQVDLPGVDKKDIEITAEKGVLTIKGERHAAAPVENKASEQRGYERIERVSGRFSRRFTLPENAQAEGITARQVNGVLEVSIPKQAQVQPKRIDVQAA